MPTEGEKRVDPKTQEPEVYTGGAWLTDWSSLGDASNATLTEINGDVTLAWSDTQIYLLKSIDAAITLPDPSTYDGSAKREVVIYLGAGLRWSNRDGTAQWITQGTDTIEPTLPTSGSDVLYMIYDQSANSWQGSLASGSGPAGESAYGAWLGEGNTGTQADFLASLASTAPGPSGNDGAKGDSAYTAAVNAGFVGDEATWIASLKGDKGDVGSDGAKGDPGNDGADGADSTVSGPQGPAGPSAPTIYSIPVSPIGEPMSVDNAAASLGTHPSLDGYECSAMYVTADETGTIPGRVGLYKNGALQGAAFAVILPAQTTGQVNFATPVTINTGDLISVRSDTAAALDSPKGVSAQVEFIKP